MLFSLARASLAFTFLFNLMITMLLAAAAASGVDLTTPPFSTLVVVPSSWFQTVQQLQAAASMQQQIVYNPVSTIVDPFMSIKLVANLILSLIIGLPVITAKTLAALNAPPGVLAAFTTGAGVIQVISTAYLVYLVYSIIFRKTAPYADFEEVF